MKWFTVTIDILDLPPSASAVEETRVAVKDLSRTVSKLSTLLICLSAIGFFAGQLHVSEGLLPKIAFAVCLAAFLMARQFEGVVNRALADVSPVPDSSLAEAALFSAATPAARQYREALRVQKREMVLAEFDALKKLVASTPVSASREELYGRPS